MDDFGHLPCSKPHSAFFALLVYLAAGVGAPGSAVGEGPQYDLSPQLDPKTTSRVNVRLEVGGEMLLYDEDREEVRELKRLPLRVEGHLRYFEQLEQWSLDPDKALRSVRQYDRAEAEIQVDKNTSNRTLPHEKRLQRVEVRNSATTFGAATPLNREQWDLVNVVGGSLVLDRLLPGRKVAEGEDWEHESSTIGALLGMDHVAVCEVTSVVTGEKHRQVQLRMAGTVHGTVDGSPTEMEVRAAYLFHQDEGRITKFNLAIKELRNPSEIAPGLDVVAKAFVTVSPSKKSLEVGPELRFDGDDSQPLPRLLTYKCRDSRFQLSHAPAWYVTAEQRDHVAFRYLYDGSLTAHANVKTLAPRSAGRHTNLKEFETDVRKSLGEQLKEVVAATEWETPQGYRCLGVIANGSVKEVPIQWRYYLVAADDLPRVTLAVTVEQSQVEAFNDAERELIDSLELLPGSEDATLEARKTDTRSR